MTEKAAIAQSLLDALDRHFAYNKKRPAGEKVDKWFALHTAGWERALLRRVRKQVERRLAARFGA